VTRRALVVGGTGPTGPYVIEGLLERGYDVTIFHRGVHEPDDLPDVRHIHGDPHFLKTVQDALDGEAHDFDVVLALYGRVKVLAEFFAGRCEQLVAIGGIPAYRGCVDPDRTRPYGVALLAREEGPLADEADANPFSLLVRSAEQAVFDLAAGGAFRGSVVRYPIIYGPRNPVPYEWSVMKRIRDGRPYMIVPDNGLAIMSRCAAPNAAGVVLAIVDHPEAADGEAYNCTDREQYSLRQWVEVVTDVVGGSLDIVSLPMELAETTYIELNPTPGIFPHVLLDGSKASRDLAYTEVIAARDAIAATVAWLDRNPPQPGEYPAYLEQFDYDAEDRLVASYRQALDDVRAQAGRTPPQQFHGMPHPKAPSGIDHRGR
jgi:nucleoside-diphosphate-sugar epimerase